LEPPFGGTLSLCRLLLGGAGLLGALLCNIHFGQQFFEFRGRGLAMKALPEFRRLLVERVGAGSSAFGFALGPLEGGPGGVEALLRCIAIGGGLFEAFGRLEPGIGLQDFAADRAGVALPELLRDGVGVVVVEDLLAAL